MGRLRREKAKTKQNAPLDFRSPGRRSCPSVSQYPGCLRTLWKLKERVGADPTPEVRFSAGVGQTKGKERRKAHGKGPPVILLVHL